MILFYQKIATTPVLDSSRFIAKCSDCHKEYFAKYKKCAFCGSELRDWVIDLFDESHLKKRKRWWRK